MSNVMSTDAPLSAIDQLVAGQRAIVLPFLLQLQHEAPLELLTSLRLLPGKRLSAHASWKGRAVMAKLFVRARRGDIYANAEQQGQRCVAAAGINTPQLLWQGQSTCGRLAVVLYEFLDGAHSFADAYSDCASNAARRADTVASMLALTATLHAHHALQSDPHLDNFLWHDGLAWLIDVGSVVIRPAALTQPERQHNLALLLAQLPLSDHGGAAVWCGQYNRACLQNGLEALSCDALPAAIDKAWRTRGENVLAKTVRDCSATQVKKKWRRFVASRRACHDATLSALLVDIDRTMQTGKMLKDGNSATVVLVERGARRWVIKRYNIKSLWHRLRRCLRPSRALQSWRNAHLLEFAGIATPAPVAVIEQRFGPLRGRAWFVSDYVPGVEMLAAYQQREPTDSELQQTLSIFHNMQLALITHGDLKAQNLMLGSDGVVRLIDLDAMQWHRSHSVWSKIFASDMQRFLRNWQGALHQRFVVLLEALSSQTLSSQTLSSKTSSSKGSPDG